MRELTIHCDGSCYWKDGRMGLGIAWFDVSDIPYGQGITAPGKGTSNQAEYLAILHALTIITLNSEIIWNKIIIYSDSQLVISQLTDKYQINNTDLQYLYDRIYSLVWSLSIPVEFKWVPRTNPRQQIADKLSKEANPYFKEKKK